MSPVHLLTQITANNHLSVCVLTAIFQVDLG